MRTPSFRHRVFAAPINPQNTAKACPGRREFDLASRQAAAVLKDSTKARSMT